MHLSFAQYTRRVFANVSEAVINIFIFTPYFFSVDHLFRTLFAPWKNIYAGKPKKGGMSLSDVMSHLGDIFVSRFMGFMARSALISAYVMIQILFVIFIPMIYIFTLVFIPLLYVWYTSHETPQQKHDRLKNEFVKRHLVEPQNAAHVEEWFKHYFENIEEKPWWKLDQLMSQPPLGRDLSAGYTPQVDEFGDELTLMKPHYKHLVGRKKELDVIQQALSKTGEANVILSGEDGVGKHAIIEGLGKLIYEGACNPRLAFKRIIELDMDKILSTETDHAKRTEFMSTFFEEAIQAKNIILVIPHIDEYTSSEENRTNLTNVFQQYAQNDAIQIIGTTTPYLYQKYIYSNPSVADLFDKVDVSEVTVEETIHILMDLALDMERKNKTTITYQALVSAAKTSHQYLSNMPLPEKAIELLDEAVVYSTQHLNSGAVTEHVVNTVLQHKTHVPIELTDKMKKTLVSIDATLKNRIIQQDEAVEAVSSSLRKAFVIANNSSQPIASFLFLGPTGVGKTETAKALTEQFFGTQDEFLMRFDMSLYQSKNDIDTLIGSQERGEPGLLTQIIREKQYGVLLLDELEKANKDLLNIFLTILDEGYYTDGFGKRVDCSHLIIIATSNAGAQFIYEHLQNGGTPEALNSLLIDYLVKEGIYSPEFLNRFDGVIVFKPLSQDAIKTIARIMLSKIAKDVLAQHNITATFSEKFIDSIIAKGYDSRFGARNMQRVIQSEVEDVISKAILASSDKPQVIQF